MKPLLTLPLMMALAATVIYANSESGSCLPDWHDGTSNGANCYFYRKDLKLPWIDAKVVCKTLSESSFLAEPKDRKQFNFVANMLDEEEGTRSHLGATDAAEEGRWLWQESAEEVSEELWAPRQPDNYYQDGEQCMEIAKGRFHGRYGLNDNDCDIVQTFICEMKPRDHHDKSAEKSGSANATHAKMESAIRDLRPHQHGEMDNLAIYCLLAGLAALCALVGFCCRSCDPGLSVVHLISGLLDRLKPKTGVDGDQSHSAHKDPVGREEGYVRLAKKDAEMNI